MKKLILSISTFLMISFKLLELFIKSRFFSTNLIIFLCNRSILLLKNFYLSLQLIDSTHSLIVLINPKLNLFLMLLIVWIRKNAFIEDCYLFLYSRLVFPVCHRFCFRRIDLCSGLQSSL